MAGYTRQEAANIVDAAVIEASYFNNEYNALESAFNASTGHAHDGSAGEGPKISLTAAVSGILPVANGGTASSTASGARTSLGLVIGTDVQAYDAGLNDISGLSVTDGNIIVGNGTNWVAESGATARTSLGVPSTAEAALVANNLSDLASASSARTNLGLAIGTDVQAYDAGLNDISGLAVTDGNFIVGNGTNWVAESGSTARTSLGVPSTTEAALVTNNLSDLDSASSARTNLGLAIGTDVQAYDAGLADIAGLAVTNSNFIVGDGANWVAESGATARTSLGLTIGTDVQAYDAGLADIAGLAVTDGKFIVGNGTNWVAESGTTARTSLGAVGYLDDIDWTGDHTFNTSEGIGTSTISSTVNGGIRHAAYEAVFPTSVSSGIAFRVDGSNTSHASYYDAENEGIFLVTDTPTNSTFGSVYTTYWNSPTPAVSDVLILHNIFANDSGANATNFGRISYTMDNVTDTTEEGSWSFATMVSGTLDTDAMVIGDGVTLGAPTGGLKGAGTLNATAVYDDNTLLTDYVADFYNSKLDTDQVDFYNSLWTGDGPSPVDTFLEQRTQSTLDVDTYINEFLSTGSLPAMPTREEWLEGKWSTGQLINSLWETVEVLTLHIKDLNERIA